MVQKLQQFEGRKNEPQNGKIQYRDKEENALEKMVLGFKKKRGFLCINPKRVKIMN